MADANRTAGVFESLRLSSFPEEWVKTCWDEDFVDLSTLPLECEALLSETGFLTDQLQAVQRILDIWLESKNENENGEGFWSVLVENEIPHKALVAVLAYLVHNAGKVSVSFKERAAGVMSASVYLKLVVLPGSSAFKIYHPELLVQACRLLDKWSKTDCGGPSKRKRSASPVKASQRSQRGKRGKKQKRGSVDPFQMGDSDENEEEEDIQELTVGEYAELDTLMSTLLQDVLTICEKYSLRQSESTAVQLLSVLVGLTRINAESIKEEMGEWTSSRCSPGILAYKAIYLLCQPFHGHVTALTSEVCKLLLNHILMLEDGKVFSSLGRPVMMMRRHGLSFVSYLAKEVGERCVQCVKTLIQHVCFKAPDRSEYRCHSAQAIHELCECLPDNEFAKVMEWLKRLSKCNKVSQRSFVLDIISVLLEKPERKLSAEVPPDLVEFATHKSMVCTMLSRCSDSNASVRSRALVGFSSCMNSKYNDVVSTIKEVITPVVSLGRPTAKHFVPTPKMAIVAKTGEEDCTKDTTSASHENAPKNHEGIEVPDSNADNNQEKAAEDNNDITSYGSSSKNSNSNTPQMGPRNKSFCHIELTPGFNPYLPDTEGVISMFHRRALDTKVIVRKSALQALQNVIHFMAPTYRAEDLSVLQERCADPALSVRKQAVQSLFELLQAYPHDAKFQKAWLLGLLPQVMDRETSVQEKCFDQLEEMILHNLKPANRTDEFSLEWELLGVVADETSEKLRRYLQKGCQYWARTKKFKPAMISAVQSHIGERNDKAAWMFLAEIAKTNVKICHDLVVSHWRNQSETFQDDPACAKWSNVLNVISATAKAIPSETVTQILADLKQRLCKFSYPTPLISGMVNCVSKLHGCLQAEASQRQMQAWGEELMAECDKYMSDVILHSDGHSNDYVDEEQLIKYMFTLGEVCQRCPARMPKRAALLIQSIIAAPCLGDVGNSGDFTSAPTQATKSHSENDTEHSESSQASQSQPPSSQPDSQTSHSQASSGACSQPLSQFRGSNMSGKLRAHAFITLGKLCLVDEALAKKTIAALARELEESDSPAVRNNVVIVMGDLTIRYTTLVDRYITNIAACLKDPAALVRKNTLTVLTRLLQEEYVKWKGVLFFRYITTLLDDVLEIKDLAEFCLEHLLLKKHPNMFFHPFLECIFHFNNYQTHAVFNKFKQTDREKHKFTLAGKENTSRRMRLYLFMLEHMADDQRFKVTAKISKEILSAVVDQIIPLDNEGSMLLKDALAILTSKEIKLSSLKCRGADELSEEGADVAQIVTATAKKALITQVVKRNVIENIVPVVISLKHMLEKNRSPLLKDLMAYLRELMKDYKNEVKDILAADKQLAEEIEFDLRNFENQQAERDALANGQMAGTPTSSHAGTPTVSRPSSKQSSRAGSPLVQLYPQPNQVLNEVGGTANVPLPVPSVTERRNSPSERRRSLTIADAAKKALSRVDQLRQSGSPFSPGRKSQVSSPTRAKQQPVRDSGSSHSQKSTEQESENDENTTGTPTRSDKDMRAISTPTDGLYNITFGVDANVTLLPPSPIPSLASAVNGGRLCLSPTLKIQRKGNKDIIHMPHPEGKDPKLQKWNIQSPTAKKAEPQNQSADNSSTPSRKAHTASRAGIRRSGRHKKS